MQLSPSPDPAAAPPFFWIGKDGALAGEGKETLTIHEISCR
jgi:hypothetical protein